MINEYSNCTSSGDRYCDSCTWCVGTSTKLGAEQMVVVPIVSYIDQHGTEWFLGQVQDIDLITPVQHQQIVWTKRIDNNLVSCLALRDNDVVNNLYWWEDILEHIVNQLETSDRFKLNSLLVEGYPDRRL